MRESRALAVSNEGEVLHEIVYGGGGALDGLRCNWHMLDAFLAGLEEVGEVGDSEGIQVGILGRDGALVSRGR